MYLDFSVVFCLDFFVVCGWGGRCWVGERVVEKEEVRVELGYFVVILGFGLLMYFLGWLEF